MLSRCERQALEALSFHNQEPNKLLLGFINYLGSGSGTRKWTKVDLGWIHFRILHCALMFPPPACSEESMDHVSVTNGDKGYASHCSMALILEFTVHKGVMGMNQGEEMI